jgi:RNA polymerase sigma-70 factor (ECF subfamily)
MNLKKSESKNDTNSGATEAPCHGLTELEVIERAQGGNAAAFESLYKSHVKQVYSVCLRMLRNTADAEDLTQHIFLQVFRKIRTFRGESGFSAWLHRVTVNTVLMHMRRKKPTDSLTDSLDDIRSDGGEPREFGAGDVALLGTIDRLNLARAIRQLPCGCKRHFLLHDVVGFRHREIAGLLGCSVISSKSQLHRARKRLRCLLQGQQEAAELNAACA